LLVSLHSNTFVATPVGVPVVVSSSLIMALLRVIDPAERLDHPDCIFDI
jgi:hypothetical protein